MAMQPNGKPDEKTLNDQIQSLLTANLNVILTGAPGTGKTYTAKEVAKALSEDNWVVEEEETTSGVKIKKGKWEHGRIASVQFHPGYDYSDFVIGMKPVLLAEDGKELEKKDGKYVIAGTKTIIEDTDIGEAKVSFRWQDGVFKKFADKAREEYNNAENKAEVPKFVFLIDEINRADLSRVFGELFSLLEEEYRYPNDKGSDSIMLPNGEHFSIPKNLYIIGTMNDIDRSVESMDFALRRRFAWKEVKPEYTVDDILKEIPEKETLRAKMEAVNSMIRSAEMRLGDQYQLGGAIFAKLGKYVKRYKKGNPKKAKSEALALAFGHLWENHIKNILFEYLRGRSDSGKSLDDLRKAYDMATKDGPSSAEDIDWTGKRIKIIFPNGDSIADDPKKRESVQTLLQFVQKVCRDKNDSIQQIMECDELSGSKNKFLIEASEWENRENRKMYNQITVNERTYYVLTNTSQNDKVRHILTISKLLGLEVDVAEVKP